jgi:hypothetical protein
MSKPSLVVNKLSDGSYNIFTESWEDIKSKMNKSRTIDIKIIEIEGKEIIGSDGALIKAAKINDINIVRVRTIETKSIKNRIKEILSPRFV